MQPILGTALWGWTTPKNICFALLDTFYERGFRQVDTATNYPINKNEAHFRMAENTLLEWIKAHGISDLKVMIKVGSINNMGTPDNNTSKSFLLINIDDYLFRFEDNLDTFMIHWDNSDNEVDILGTMEALSIAQKQGLQPGLSGIKHPAIYAKFNANFNLNLRIQIKHNILQSSYNHYVDFHDSADFLAYGINAGGIKLDSKEYHNQSSYIARGGDQNLLSPKALLVQNMIDEARQKGQSPPFSSFNECGLIHAYGQSNIKGVLLGTSRLEQLHSSLDFMQYLEQNFDPEIYQRLQKIAHD